VLGDDDDTLTRASTTFATTFTTFTTTTTTTTTMMMMTPITASTTAGAATARRGAHKMNRTPTTMMTSHRRHAANASRTAVRVRANGDEERDEYMFANEKSVQGALNRDNPQLEEKFAVIGQGDYQCQSCMYEYKPKVGDDFYPVSAGTAFKDLPGDWQCPTCGAPKAQFKSLGKAVAGFEVNQGYGLGTNSMTEGEKSRLIYGGLALFFALFLSGYLLE
jgi:rubredoxin